MTNKNISNIAHQVKLYEKDNQGLIKRIMIDYKDGSREGITIIPDMTNQWVIDRLKGLIRIIEKDINYLN